MPPSCNAIYHCGKNEYNFSHFYLFFSSQEAGPPRWGSFRKVLIAAKDCGFFGKTKSLHIFTRLFSPCFIGGNELIFVYFSSSLFIIINLDLAGDFFARLSKIKNNEEKHFRAFFFNFSASFKFRKRYCKKFYFENR